MRRVIWSRPSRDDLRGIDDWLTRKASPDFALRTIGAIRLRAKFLEDFSHGGRPHRDGKRVLRVRGTSYLILYELVQDDVRVLRVHHEREDWHVEP